MKHGGESMLSGKCVGGPANGGMLHHGEPTYAVGRDRNSKRLIVGWQGGDTEDVQAAAYVYQFSDGVWLWTPRRNATAQLSGEGT